MLYTKACGNTNNTPFRNNFEVTPIAAILRLSSHIALLPCLANLLYHLHDRNNGDLRLVNFNVVPTLFGD